MNTTYILSSLRLGLRETLETGLNFFLSILDYIIGIHLRLLVYLESKVGIELALIMDIFFIIMTLIIILEKKKNSEERIKTEKKALKLEKLSSMIKQIAINEIEKDKMNSKTS